MVGFIAPKTVKEEEYHNQDSKSRTPTYALESINSEVVDLSFADSFLDFDSIRAFFEDSSDFDRDSSVKIHFGGLEKSMETGNKQSSILDGSEVMVKEESSELERGGNLGDKEFCFQTPSVLDGSKVMVKEESLELEKEGNLDSAIEEEMGRVHLIGSSSGDNAASISVVPDGYDAKIEGANDENRLVIVSAVNNLEIGEEDKNASDSESGRKSSSSSASSSDSSSDDDEEEEEGEMEEGELRDVNDEDEEEEEAEKMVEWSDTEFDDVGDEEEGVGVIQGPIKSKNELTALPPVSPVDATLQPHHQMQPVGIVLSMLGTQVIVEGVEKHSPLNEGSILWITEKRAPLGLVDEIFGPVQNPYYIVRYNSESEVPAGIHSGTSISFVPEFACHVLIEKNLYKKGYDASGENDEELSDDAEFSDDEKEAEHKRKQKMSKRGMNHPESEQRGNNRNKVKNRNGNWKNSNNNNNVPSGKQRKANMGQHNSAPVVASTSTGGAAFFLPFPPVVPSGNFFQAPNGGWGSAFPTQQPNNAFMPSVFLPNNVPWPAQNQLQQVPFQQQFNPSHASLPNAILPGVQMNFFAGPRPWPAVPENCFNQPQFGIGFPGQPPLPVMNGMNVEGQGMMPNQLNLGQNGNLLPPSGGSSNIQAPCRFNSGAGGGKPGHQGGGRGSHFVGGRGRQAPK